MVFQFNPYVIPLFIGVIPLFGLAVLAWRRGDTLDVRLFCLNAVSTCGLIIAYGMEMLSGSEAAIHFWLKVEYLFFYIPALWLLFVLAYTGHEQWVTPRRALLLFLPSVAHTLSAWTNEYHYLNWSTVGTKEVDGLLLFERTYGPSFILACIYYAVLILAMLGVTLHSFARAPKPFRLQIGLLLVAVSFPLATFVITIFTLSPFPYFDLTPFGFLVAYIFIGGSLLRYRLLDLVPTARPIVLNSIADMILVVDNRRRIVDINPAGEHFVGRRAAEIVGKTVEQIFSRVPDLAPQFQDAPETTEIDVMHAGQQHTFDLRVSPIYTRGGLRGHVVVLHDITGRKRIEDTLRQYAAQLEVRNSELDAFTHTVAHDLKSPLQIIVGYTELLQEVDRERLSDTGMEYLSYVQESAGKLTDMISALLLLAQIRDANTALTRVELGPVVNAALARFQRDIAARGIGVTVHTPLPAACAHPAWVEAVIANLLGNAIKYIGQDNPAPRIEIRGGYADGMAYCDVEDNGVGIDPADQQRLFDMFTRFHRSEASGTGLGLSIVYRIITRLNGQIEVRSARGAGSTFRIALPAAVEAQPVPPELSGETTGDRVTQLAS